MSLFAEAAPLAGRIAFAAVFLLLLVWLIFMPKRLLGDADRPLWKQARTWALAIAAVQLLIYLCWK